MADVVLPLWQINVPTIHNNGKPFRTRFHKVWDAKVRKITGGLTVYKPAIGQWKADNGNLFIERMIPVHIACTEEQIQQISDLTAKHYEQLTIFFYRVSEEAHLIAYDPDRKFARVKQPKGESSCQ